MVRLSTPRQQRTSIRSECGRTFFHLFRHLVPSAQNLDGNHSSSGVAQFGGKRKNSYRGRTRRCSKSLHRQPPHLLFRRTSVNQSCPSIGLSQHPLSLLQLNFSLAPLWIPVVQLYIAVIPVMVF